MFNLFGSKPKATNPFEDISDVVDGTLEVVDILQIGGTPTIRGRLKLFLQHLNTVEHLAFDKACKTFGDGTVKRFLISDIDAPPNVIETLIARGQVGGDTSLLELSDLKDSFQTYLSNLDAA